MRCAFCSKQQGLRVRGVTSIAFPCGGPSVRVEKKENYGSILPRSVEFWYTHVYVGFVCFCMKDLCDLCLYEILLRDIAEKVSLSNQHVLRFMGRITYGISWEYSFLCLTTPHVINYTAQVYDIANMYAF